MNSELKSLMLRAAGWPEVAQQEAVLALAKIERKHLDGNIEALQSRIHRSLADSRPDLDLDEAFDRIERLHESS
jgi:hypothetical protein